MRRPRWRSRGEARSGSPGLTPFAATTTTITIIVTMPAVPSYYEVRYTQGRRKFEKIYMRVLPGSAVEVSEVAEPREDGWFGCRVTRYYIPILA